MPTRRSFLQALAAASLKAGAAPPFPSRRPPPEKRNFTSPAVEAKIAEVKKSIADPELAWLFENCFPNTLDTTVRTGAMQFAVHEFHDPFSRVLVARAPFLEEVGDRVRLLCHLMSNESELFWALVALNHLGSNDHQAVEAWHGSETRRHRRRMSAFDAQGSVLESYDKRWAGSGL